MNDRQHKFWLILIHSSHLKQKIMKIIHKNMNSNISHLILPKFKSSDLYPHSFYRLILCFNNFLICFCFISHKEFEEKHQRQLILLLKHSKNSLLRTPLSHLSNQSKHQSFTHAHIPVVQAACHYF